MAKKLAQKHFLLLDLEKAEQDSKQDFSLSMTAKHTYTEFFKDEKNKTRWKERLNSLKDLDLKRSPLFEAIFLFGRWKTEKDYKKALKSAKRFEEMEKIACQRDWVWTLVYCLETIVDIYKALRYYEQLKVVCKRIRRYLSEKKEMFQAHTMRDLANLFTTLITNADREDIDEVLRILVELSEKEFGADPFSFQRSFLFEAVKIARFLKMESDVKKLQEKIIQNWINEAEFKGKASKLIKVTILERALDYCANVGNKERISQIKRILSEIDFKDELKEISLPEEEKKKFKRALVTHYEKMREIIRKFVDRLSGLTPLNILWNLCNDNSIVRVNVKETKEFVQELMQKYPLQHIFGTSLNTGEKTIRLESTEEKARFQLHQQLMFGVNETIWVVNQILNELIERNLLTMSSIGNFLTMCSCVSKKNFQLIGFGTLHHFHKNYVASISILTPLIENVLFDYLSTIGADVSSYQGKVIEQRELGGLLDLNEFKDSFGEDFQYFLKLLLVEPDSINFRNRFAHGNVAVEEFNETVSSIILFTLLKISSKTFVINK